jgi:tripartite-type tricarboxylate transporter receptor subunit TctC
MFDFGRRPDTERAQRRKASLSADRAASRVRGARRVPLGSRQPKEAAMSRLFRLLPVTVLLLASAVATAAAQSYPTRSIKLLVAFPPGGATDVIARTIGQPLSQRLGQSVVVDNRPGSNGNIAAELAARARPDGYTLMIGSDSLFGINPHLYAKMPVDPHKEFVPVATLISNQLVLAVNPSAVPANDMREFVAFVGRASTPLFYASIGNGSQHHLAMELLKQRSGLSLTHAPYKGGGPAAIAVVSGECVAMFGGGSVVPLIKSGKLKGLAVSGPRRSLALPELPTIGETFPGYEATIWQALFAPAGTPQAILDKLRSEVNAVLAQPEVAERLIASGSGEPSVMALEEFAALMRSDYAKYGKLIKDIGVTVD